MRILCIKVKSSGKSERFAHPPNKEMKLMVFWLCLWFITMSSLSSFFIGMGLKQPYLCFMMQAWIWSGGGIDGYLIKLALYHFALNLIRHEKLGCVYGRRPGMLRFMGSQRVGHNSATELNWTELKSVFGKLESYEESVLAYLVNTSIVYNKCVLFCQGSGHRLYDQFQFLKN